MTNRAEQNVRITHQLYEARRCARFLLSDAYGERIAGYMRLVRTAMAREGKPPLSATLVLAKHTDEPMVQMFLMAAAVEVIEQDEGISQ